MLIQGAGESTMSVEQNQKPPHRNLIYDRHSKENSNKRMEYSMNAAETSGFPYRKKFIHK